jgi:hypothetical protein
MSQKNRNRKRRNRKPDSAPLAKTSSSIIVALNNLSLNLDLSGLAAHAHGLHVIGILNPFTVMLAMTKTENPVATDVFRNGTGALIDTGQRELLITNHHVYEGFEKCRREVPCTRLLMSGLDGRNFANISDQNLIASDNSCDLATLAVSPSIVERIGNGSIARQRGRLNVPKKERAWS